MGLHVLRGRPETGQWVGGGRRVISQKGSQRCRQGAGGQSNAMTRENRVRASIVLAGAALHAHLDFHKTTNKE
jgi:hypothetical protein